MGNGDAHREREKEGDEYVKICVSSSYTKNIIIYRLQATIILCLRPHPLLIQHYIFYHPLQMEQNCRSISQTHMEAITCNKHRFSFPYNFKLEGSCTKEKVKGSYLVEQPELK